MVIPPKASTSLVINRRILNSEVDPRQREPARADKLETSASFLFEVYEQALVCLSDREIVDASRGRTFHCKMANNRFFL